MVWKPASRIAERESGDLLIPNLVLVDGSCGLVLVECVACIALPVLCSLLRQFKFIYLFNGFSCSNFGKMKKNYDL